MNYDPITWVIGLLHKIASHPWIYDRIQIAAGQKRSFKRLAAFTAPMRAEIIVDVGGGTGAWRILWPSGIRYICLDNEMPKLRGFRSKVPSGLAVLSDASSMPIGTGSVDVVTCIAMVHHLPDAKFDQVLAEAQRVLKVDGRLILLDPVLNREFWTGRLLWRLDRGSNPRTAEDLRRKMQTRFKIEHWEKFAIYHEYALGIGVRT